MLFCRGVLPRTRPRIAMGRANSNLQRSAHFSSLLLDQRVTIVSGPRHCLLPFGRGHGHSGSIFDFALRRHDGVVVCLCSLTPLMR